MTPAILHSIISVLPHNTHVYADVMKTFLRNSIGNAIKFSMEGGKIEIFTERNNDKVNLVIKDDGVEISEEAMKKIFSETYYTTLGTRHEKGTGLGLMICHDFAKSNNAQLAVNSKKGESACFTINLPAHKILVPFRDSSINTFQKSTVDRMRKSSFLFFKTK